MQTQRERLAAACGWVQWEVDREKWRNIPAITIRGQPFLGKEVTTSNGSCPIKELTGLGSKIGLSTNP